MKNSYLTNIFYKITVVRGCDWPNCSNTTLPHHDLQYDSDLLGKMSEGVCYVLQLNNTYFQSSTVLLSCFIQLGTKRLYSYTLSQRLSKCNCKKYAPQTFDLKWWRDWDDQGKIPWTMSNRKFCRSGALRVDTRTFMKPKVACSTRKLINMKEIAAISKLKEKTPFYALAT